MELDYSAECSMCGKPMSPRYCGMCVSCEQIDNDVPEYDPRDTAFVGWEGHCPECGGHLVTVGGNYADECQYDKCENCDWYSDLDC